MTFNSKMEILLRRKGMRKTEFAEKVGITYRALANYMSGARKPRPAVLSKMEELLEVPRGFLFDNEKNLILDSEERFLHEASAQSTDLDSAAALLSSAKKIFSGKGLTAEDKQSLFSCLTEIYFDAANKRSS